MQLFPENPDIEGIDTYNACYGGTNALFNAINWIESSSWDGRDAIVVAGDIALYDNPAARPTGGAGCVAMLVGSDAPIVFDPFRASHMANVYDFYKPDFGSEYPLVDGGFSNRCYLEALGSCYRRYLAKRKTREGDMNGQTGGTGLDAFDYFLFHAPNCKLVAKAYGRLLYSDYLAGVEDPVFGSVPESFREMEYTASLTDKSLEKTFMNLTKGKFDKRVKPTLTASTMCGNMYTASLYSGLVSLVSNVPPAELQGKRVGLFSYGSGLASSLFSLRVKGDVSYISEKIDLRARLDKRRAVDPEVYDEVRLPFGTTVCVKLTG